MKNLIAEGRKLQEKFMTESRIDELDMNKVDWQKVKVTYTGKDGKQRRIQLHSALTYDKKHPAYKAGMEMYNRMKKKGEAGTKPSLSTKVNKKKPKQNIFAQKPEEAPQTKPSDNGVDRYRQKEIVSILIGGAYSEDPKARSLHIFTDHSLNVDDAYDIAKKYIGGYNEFKPQYIKMLGDGTVRLGREYSPVAYYTPTKEQEEKAKKDPQYWEKLGEKVKADEVGVYTEDDLKSLISMYTRNLQDANEKKDKYFIDVYTKRLENLKKIKPGEVRFWWD